LLQLNIAQINPLLNISMGRNYVVNLGLDKGALWNYGTKSTEQSSILVADISAPIHERPRILRFQDLAICPFTEQDQFNPHARIPFFEDWW
jgi:hypothetical protein